MVDNTSARPTSQSGAAEIIEYLRAQATEKLKAAVSSKPLESLAIGSPGLFPYYWQDTKNPTLAKVVTKFQRLSLARIHPRSCQIGPQAH